MTQIHPTILQTDSNSLHLDTIQQPYALLGCTCRPLMCMYFPLGVKSYKTRLEDASLYDGTR